MSQTVASRSLLALTRELNRQLSEAETVDPLAREIEDLVLAALTVCADRSDALTALDVAAVIRSHDQAKQFDLRPWDLLPFELMLSMVGATDVSPSRVLLPHLTVGPSALRLWAFEIGWIARRRLDARVLMASLLLNVENTIGYWSQSLALCRGLFDSDEEFHRSAAEYEPQDMPEQFQSRMEDARESWGEVLYPAILQRRELAVQRRIVRYVLGGLQAAPDDGRKCATCNEGLGGYEARTAFLVSDAMGDEATDSIWHCALCGQYTKETYVDSFFGEDRVSVSAMSAEVGAERSAFLRGGATPGVRRWGGGVQGVGGG